MRSKIFVGIGLVIVALLSVGAFFRDNPQIVEQLKTGQKIGTTSACPEPLILETPVDMSKVTSVLYPGQERGGDFKPHGGFRFDNATPDEIVVKAPMDGKLQEIQKYMEGGEIQYMMDFAHPCGIVYRLDHLATLSPKFEELSKNLPTLSEDSWKKGHDVKRRSADIYVQKGEVIATAVGFRKTNNTFMDFGVYDLRGKSPFQNPRPYATCWFDLLPPSDAAKVRSLPSADSVSGSQSAYCK